MAWARISDDFFDHSKVALLTVDQIGLAAMGLWTLTLTWVRADRRRQGQIPTGIAARFAAGELKQLASRLVDVGLWDETPGGWRFHDFEDVYTPEDLSSKRAEAGRQGGVKSGLSRRLKQSASETKQNRSKTEANAKQNGSKPRVRAQAPLPTTHITPSGSGPYDGPGGDAREPVRGDEPPTVVETIISEYRDNSPNGVSSSVAEKLALQIHQLLRDGFKPDHIREALPLLRIKRLGPGMLATLVDEVANRPPDNVVALVTARPSRPSTTDQRVNAGLALMAKYAEQEQQIEAL